MDSDGKKNLPGCSTHAEFESLRMPPAAADASPVAETEQRDMLLRHAEDLARLKEDSARQALSIENVVPAMGMLAKKLASMREDARANATAVKTQLEAIDARLCRAETAAADMVQMKAHSAAQANAVANIGACLDSLLTRIGAIRHDTKAEIAELGLRMTALDECLRGFAREDTGKATSDEELGKLRRQLAGFDAEMRQAVSSLKAEIARVKAESAAQVNLAAAASATPENLTTKRDARAGLGGAVGLPWRWVKALRKPRTDEPISWEAERLRAAQEPQPYVPPGQSQADASSAAEAAQQNLKVREVFAESMSRVNRRNEKRERYLRIATLAATLLLGAMTDVRLLLASSVLMEASGGAALADESSAPASAEESSSQ